MAGKWETSWENGKHIENAWEKSIGKMDGFFGSEKIIELGIFMSLQMFDIPEG